MKKKQLLLALLLSMTVGVSLYGCGEKPEEEKTEESSESKEDKEADEEDKDSSDDDKDEEKEKEKTYSKSSNDAIAVYSGVTETYEAGEWYDVESADEVELRILDDTNCQFIRRTVFGDSSFGYTYAATYEELEDCFAIEYFDGYETVNTTVFVNGTDIVKVADQYSGDNDYTSIVGRYSLDTELGQVVFEVDENGLVDGTVTVANKKYDTGSLFTYDYDGEDGDVFDPEWDLTFSIGDSYYDWYIYFSKNGATYVPYREAIYGPFAGSYTMDGSLGLITVVADNEGNASASIAIDGDTYDFSGSLSYDYYNDQITFDLYSDGCDLHLYVDRFEDGDWYQGYYSMTVYLPAG